LDKCANISQTTDAILADTVTDHRFRDEEAKSSLLNFKAFEAEGYCTDSRTADAFTIIISIIIY